MDNDCTNLFKSVAKGDRSAFDTLFRLYYRDLCRYAVFLSLSPADAEDAVQDLFFRIWENRKQLVVTTSAKSYLLSAVKNITINRHKHHEVQAKYVSHVLHVEKDDSEANGDGKEELFSKLDRVIRQLPEKRREIFVMSKIEGLRYTDIADSLGISIKTVENQMGEALKYLRENLTGTEILILALLLKNHILVNFMVGVFSTQLVN